MNEMKRLLEAMSASTTKKKLTEAAPSANAATRKAIHDLAALYVEGLVEFAEDMGAQDPDMAMNMDEALIDYFEQEWDEQTGIFGKLRDSIRDKIKERVTKPARGMRGR